MADLGKILIIDDNEDVLFALNLLLKTHCGKVKAMRSPERIVHFMTDFRPDIVLLDMNFTRDTVSGEEGMECLQTILKLDPNAVVVMMTAYADTEKAVQAIKAGATDFVSKPWDNGKLLATLHAAMKLRRSQADAIRLKERVEALSAEREEACPELIGESDCMKRVADTVAQIGDTDVNVLLLGENGTGKDVLAHLLLAHSARSAEPFVRIDVGAVPETLFESELFGHEKGAFTDARREKAGRMEAAHGGTLFLDEIGNLPLPMQAKLLTALEKRVITRLGGTEQIPIDVRLICATNAQIRHEVEQGRFRQDLLYRINTIELRIPPLRERGEDILLLAEFFLGRTARKYHKAVTGINREARQKLMRYAWPGNVRELSNALQKALVFNSGAPVSIRDLQLVLDSPAAHPPAAGLSINGNGDTGPAPGVRRSPVGTGNGFHEGEAPVEDAPASAGVPHNDEQRSLASIVTACLRSGDPSPFDTCMDIMGRAVVREALRQCRGNRSQAARLLGLSRPTLLARMEKYGLKIETRISDE